MIGIYNIALRLFLSTCLATCSAFSLLAQFEGHITYEMEYRTNDSVLHSMIEFFPQESELFISGASSRFQQNISGGGQQIYISNDKNKKHILIMNFLAEAFQVQLTQQNLEQLEHNPPYKITQTDETKEILGLVCKKAYASRGNDTLNFFYNEDLYKGNVLPQFHGIKGLVLEYETKQNELQIHFRAREIKHEPVNSELFEIAIGLREVTFEDFAKAFVYKKDSQ